MHILFFDTETNGLPWNRYASYRNTDNWPHIVQIAWQVWNFSSLTEPYCIQHVNALIKPRADMKWDEDAAAIHKIQRKDLEGGVEVSRALEWFKDDCNRADYVVAHNLQFDKNVLLSESMRLFEKGATAMNPDIWWPQKAEICTMKASTPLCAIMAKKGTPDDPYKWPTLLEFHTWLFPGAAKPENLHNADTDVMVLIQCVREMLRRRLLVLEPRISVAERSDRFVDFLRSLLRWVS